jgi:hypothetical protein
MIFTLLEELEELLDQSLANAEPTLRSLRQSVYLCEQVKYFGQHLSRDANTAILDSNHDRTIFLF